MRMALMSQRATAPTINIRGQSRGNLKLWLKRTTGTTKKRPNS